MAVGSRVQLHRPAAAVFHGPSSSQVRYSGSQSETRPTSTNMTAVKWSFFKMLAEPVHESARPSSNVSSSGLGGSFTGRPRTKSTNVCRPIV